MENKIVFCGTLEDLCKRVSKLEYLVNRQMVTQKQGGGIPVQRKVKTPAPDVLCFDFNRVKRKDVYQAFLPIIRRGGLDMDIMEVCRFLEYHTNLGKTNSIHALLYYHGKRRDF